MNQRIQDPDAGNADNLVNWAKRHDTPHLSESVSPLIASQIVRAIHPLAASGKYDAFPPMKRTATVFTPPLPRGRQVHYLPHMGLTTARAGSRPDVA